jgi:GMP synthase (glutamine-hydrolysing)
VTTEFDTVLVVDFGAQYAQLIARRVRECHVYSEIVPHTITAAEILARRPKGIILSGGPKSVHVEGAPALDPDVYGAGVPVLGICYGAQLIAQQLGGEVAQTGRGEYGRTAMEQLPASGSLLLVDLPSRQDVWMSHFDSIVRPPPGFSVTARTAEVAVAALEDRDTRIFGVQFHPEVMHTERGMEVLRRFLFDACDCRPTWTMTSIIEQAVEDVQRQVGSEKVLCALSGGVDSAVAAALVHKAVGDQLVCVYVATGLMRAGESEQIEHTFHDQFDIGRVHVKAADRFLGALDDINAPERQRKIIGREFIRTFEAAEARVFGDAASGTTAYLVQGTLYPDVIESGGSEGSSTIKSHHNVGGLPDDLQFELVEPLRTLFKDEVRMVGEQLGLPPTLVWRQPFPGPGLGIRIIGEVTRERLDILRAADLIAREELTAAGLDRDIWQFPVVLLAEVRSVGVQGDGRTYGHPVVLRPVTAEDAMTADWARLPFDLLEKISTRITNEVAEVNRVTLDITSKPPGTIEWE